MADTRRVYIDTCCFIDLVKVEIGAGVDPERENDAWHVKKLMEAHRDGEVLLFTSTLTIAECRHAGESPPSDAVKSQFARVLTSGQYVRLVQMTPFIAQDARDLSWTHSINLAGADSVHVASAIEMKCEELLTSNGRMGRVGKHADTLLRLGLVCRQGRDTQCLPQKYRQQDAFDGKPH